MYVWAHGRVDVLDFEFFSQSHLTSSASASSLDSENAVTAFKELDLQLGLHPAILSKEVFSFVEEHYSKEEFPSKTCNDLFLSLLGIVDKCHDASLEFRLRGQVLLEQ